MEDWEKLGNRLDIGRATINNIKEKCIHSITVAECRRRELVVAYCDKLPSGDPQRVALDIAWILDEMGQKRQAQILRQLFTSMYRKLCNLYMYMCMNYWYHLTTIVFASFTFHDTTGLLSVWLT